MAERKYRFKGHESFILRDGWLNKGLRALEKDKKVFFANSGADELGVGVNMAKSIRYWLRCAGLSKESKGSIELSTLGNLILEKDPYLENIFSLWLIHCNIAKNQKEATTWNLFFQEFDSIEFNPEYLKKEMLQMVKDLPNLDTFSERSVTEDCDVLLRMYTRQKEKGKTPEEKNVSPFGGLGLIRNRNDIYIKEQPALNKIPEELILYLVPQTEGFQAGMSIKEPNANRSPSEMLMGKEGTFVDETKNSISIDDLLEGKNSPGKLLNLKRSGLLELLERLAARNMIQINRTAGLDMIYLKDIDEIELLENCYKRLLGEHK